MVECKKIFKSEYADLIRKHKGDKILLNEVWHCFLDSLCRDGKITMTQYENAGNLFK